MEPEFPILDIPVGVYYKILTENHGRVTRQKTAAVTEKRKESQPASTEGTKKAAAKPARAPKPKKTKEPETSKKRPQPEASEKPPKKKLKKLRDEPKGKEQKTKEGPKRKETRKDSSEALKRYTQSISDGFFRENVATRVAYLVKKNAEETLDTRYIRFVAPNSPKGESYLVEEVDPENFRKVKDKASKETISLKQDKVYLVLEPAWLCLSFKEPRYQPVLVLLNIGRIDIEDLQLPEQPFPPDAKLQGEGANKPSIFGKDQWALIMDLKTQVLHRCNTELLFRYNPSLDASVRQDYMKRVSANLKLYSDLDYLFELNQKWLKDNEELELTAKNAASCLFSEVAFEDRRGVLLHYDRDKKALCVRVYAGNCEEPMPEIEWVHLDSSTPPKITVNMLKGKVSLPDLEKFDPAGNVKNYRPQYKHCEIQEDEDSKGKMDEKEIRLRRCKKCNYVIDNLAYLECRKCGEFFHQQCLTGETMKKGARDLQWRCADCVRCCLCLSSKGRDSLLVCATCNTGHHVKCMDPEYASQIPSSAKGKVQWKCEHCVKCVSCGAKSAGTSKQAKWSYDYTLCSKCRKRKTNNQFCPVCEQIWSTTDEEPMIQCSCGMWVHQSCDKNLTDDVFDSYKQNGRKYLCIKCRRDRRNLFVKQIVEALANEDKARLFFEPVDAAAVPNYGNIIKNPMCFKTMQEKAANEVYLADPEALKNDFELICNNAMLFNMPKTVFYKDAETLLNYGGDTLKVNWSTLQKFQAMTKEEEEYAKKVAERKKSRRALSPSLAPSKPRPMELEEDKDDRDDSEDDSKVAKKALRKRRAINYNEDHLKDPDSSHASNPLVVPAPNIPTRKRKIVAKKPQTQGAATHPKKEASSQAKEKPEPRPKNDSSSIQKLFEMLAQKDEKESKYLYSNPIIVQFNDPILCFAEMCSLCGAFGNAEDFVMCILCGESYHPYCITLPTGVSLDRIRRYWKCLNCKYCEHCCRATNEDKLLYCDSCDKAYHTFCSTPPLKVVPNCGWKCKDCFKCAKCGTQSFFDNGSGEAVAAKSVTDYTHTNNFTYCYKCGLEEHNKSLCSICKLPNTVEDNPLKHCGTCKKWSHVRCSRITLQQYEDLETRRLDFKCFACLMRERSSQEIHYEVVTCSVTLVRSLPEHHQYSLQTQHAQRLAASGAQKVPGPLGRRPRQQFAGCVCREQRAVLQNRPRC